jgi:hypothetical protein
MVLGMGRAVDPPRLLKSCCANRLPPTCTLEAVPKIDAGTRHFSARRDRAPTAATRYSHAMPSQVHPKLLVTPRTCGARQTRSWASAETEFSSRLATFKLSRGQRWLGGSRVWVIFGRARVRSRALFKSCCYRRARSQPDIPETASHRFYLNDFSTQPLLGSECSRLSSFDTLSEAPHSGYRLRRGVGGTFGRLFDEIAGPISSWRLGPSCVASSAYRTSGCSKHNTRFGEHSARTAGVGRKFSARVEHVPPARIRPDVGRAEEIHEVGRVRLG